jgi:hypothetical protein
LLSKDERATIAADQPKNISMKNLPKSILAVLATALVSCGLFSPQAQADPVAGEVRFSGNTTVDAGRTEFLSFTNVFVQNGAPNATGDFAGSQGSSVIMNGFQYNPFSAPVTPLWSFTFGGTTFSFDLNSITVIANTSTLISISGSGLLFASGVINRDPTPGELTLTRSILDEGVFRLEARAVPEPGTVALALLGIALIGVKALRRHSGVFGGKAAAIRAPRLRE